MKQDVVMNNLERKNIFMSDKTIGNLKHIINKFISISDLSRGKASKVVQNVVKNEDQCIIIKNNKPEAIILSLNEYLELIEIKEKLHELEENIELIQMANERIEKYTSSDTISHEEVLDRYDLSEEEINRLMDSVEIE